MPHKRRRVCKSSVQQAHSESGSNDLGACARNYFVKMNDDSEVADWKNHPTLEAVFVATLVEWHRNGAWDKHQKGRSNWHHLTLHMNDKCHVNLRWEQYRSKFYRMESEWKCFVRLSGMSQTTAETGVGFNSELLCFQATKEKWSALKRENKFYARFKEGRSCDCFYELGEILESRTATGKHAQSSAQSDVHHSPWSAEKTTGAASRRKGKAKVDGPTSDFWGEDVYIPVRDEEVEFVASRPGKRPVSSRGTSSFDGSRSTKS
ncbi:uncharacterized protein [Coffea arabica]|uniref:Glutathione S-transferase T3-like n=1 Tax=Coffea arabica TaxID=13443 RepID=A0ABM4W3J2_COFAR